MGGRGGRVDANQREIIEALERAGCGVLNVSQVGCGLPDLIVSWQGVIHLMEVKNPKNHYGQKGLNKNQQTFAAKWIGPKPLVVHSIDEAFVALGIRAQG